MTIAEPTILLMDESHDNALLLSTVFDRAGLGQPLRFARDGDQAIAYLRGDGVHADRTRFPVPAALLLDLQPSDATGLTVLAWVNQQPLLRSLRIYVLSGSNRPEDIAQAYALGASAYLLKPGDPAAMTCLAKALISWLKVCHFPLRTDTEEEREASILAARATGLQRSVA